MDRYKCFYDYLSDFEIQSDNHDKIECWIEQLTSEGFEINEFAREILNEFGGVSVKGKGNESRDFVELKFNPVYYASGEFDRMGLYNFVANDTLFPVGGMFDFTVYVGKHGTFYIADWKVLYECGDTIERFVEIVSSEIPVHSELLYTSTTLPEDFIDLHQTTTKSVSNSDLLHELRKIESGNWQEIYKDGYDKSGNETSVQYYQSESGLVLGVKALNRWNKG